MRRNFSEKIHTGGCDTVTKSIRLCVLPRAEHRVRIDVQSQNTCCASSGSRKGQDAGSWTDIRNALAPQIQSANTFGEILAAEEKAWMEHRRMRTKVEGRCPGGSYASPIENQMIGKE